MNQYDAVNARIQLMTLPEDRALLERWYLRFLVANTRFTISQVTEIAGQVVDRWGTDVIRDSLGEDWILRPLPATRAEWNADGYRVPADARPLLVTAEDGRKVEMFLLFDVDLVNEARVGTVDHAAAREILEPHESAPDLAEFALHIGARERRAFGHLWKAGVIVQWAPVEPDLDEVHLGALGWVESTPPPRGSFTPVPSARAEDSCCVFHIHPDAEGPEIVGQVLSLLARLILSWREGCQAEGPMCASLDTALSDLEVGIVSWVVGRRLGFGAHHANLETFFFLEKKSDIPTPNHVNWGRIVESAQLMEDLLLGVGSPLVPSPTPPVRHDVNPALVNDPFGEVGRELAARKTETDGEIAERWMVDFVAANPRFPVPVALALGWQLYGRWGSLVAGDATRASWAGTVELRSVEEWAVRGWVPRPQAELLIAPGTHGQEVYYLLRDDAIVADRLASLQSETEEELGGPALYGPPEDAPELAHFAGLVSDRERQMLRNLWWEKILPVLGDTPTELGAAHVFRARPQPAGVSPMPELISQVARWVLTRELEVLDEAPVIGRRFWSASDAETALVAHIVSQRLELDNIGDVEDASGPVCWGLVYQAVVKAESLLRGERR